MPQSNGTFLLADQRAREIYQSSKKKAHCATVSRTVLRDMANGRVYQNPGELWCGAAATQYALRAAGVPLHLVDGNGSDFEKLRALCAVLPHMAGSALKTHCSAELALLLGCDLPLTPAYCKEIWQQTGALFSVQRITPQALAARAGVDTLLVGAAPCDDLADFDTVSRQSGLCVMPAFCPDVLLAPQSTAFSGELQALAKAQDICIKGLQDLEQALHRAVRRFARQGCRIAVHSVWPTAFLRPDVYHAEQALQCCLQGRELSEQQGLLLAAQIWRILGQAYVQNGFLLELPTGGATLLESRGKTSPVWPANSFEVLKLLLEYLQSAGALPQIAVYLGAEEQLPAALSLQALESGSTRPLYGIVLGSPVQTSARLQALAAALPLSRCFAGGFSDHRLSTSLLDGELLLRMTCNLLASVERAGEQAPRERTVQALLSLVANGGKRFFHKETP